MNRQPAILSVSQVNQYIKTMMDTDRLLGGLYVQGELSNYKCYPSGHHYFTLKDSEGALRCVMFRREASSLRFRPENGMKVIVCGRVTVFPRDGQYQLYCSRMTPDGVGDLQVAFEQLKEKLRSEGLFDSAGKKPLPRFPRKIALITSPVGAAVRDMLRILKARWPLCEVVLMPVRVQGTEAPGEISAALDEANRRALADLIITGRGGGSMEDLWAFNDERVARAIHRSQIPVISAVGHEPDVTIADFVADLRAATPSNAAELAVPDRQEVGANLDQLALRMGRAMRHQLERYKKELSGFRGSRALAQPESMIQDRRLMLDYQAQRMSHGLRYTLSTQRERYGRMAAALDALSPFKVLGRGYAIPQHEDGSVAVSAGEFAPGDRLTLTMTDGSVRCLVEESECDHGGKKADI